MVNSTHSFAHDLQISTNKEKKIPSMLSSYSEVFASELLENLEVCR